LKILSKKAALFSESIKMHGHFENINISSGDSITGRITWRKEGPTFFV
jgi:hypothetical protein